MTTCKICIADVIVADNRVELAIVNWSLDDECTSSGDIGSTFSTSGPGAGWSVNHNVNDYARRAVEGGALYYLDASNGRYVEAEEVDDDDEEDVIWCSGVASRLSDWSDESVVELVVPDLDDAIQYPDALAAMVRSLSVHAAASDLDGWRDLVASIRRASDSLDGVEIPESVA